MQRDGAIVGGQMEILKWLTYMVKVNVLEQETTIVLQEMCGINKKSAAWKQGKRGWHIKFILFSTRFNLFKFGIFKSPYYIIERMRNNYLHVVDCKYHYTNRYVVPDSESGDFESKHFPRITTIKTQFQWIIHWLTLHNVFKFVAHTSWITESIIRICTGWEFKSIGSNWHGEL